MKRTVLTLLICMITLLAIGQRDKSSIKDLLLGTWSYKSGKYVYFDSNNNRLKEREMTELKDVDIDVKPESAKIIYPNKKVFTGNYTVNEENGINQVVVDLGEETVEYQISSISNSSLTLKARHEIEFYVDGDQKKKAAYGLVIITLKKKKTR